MQRVFIAGTAATPVREHFDRSLLDLALSALNNALGTITPDRVGALYVGNALGDVIAEQSQLGALIADAAGMHCEAMRIEAAGASGAMALRQGFQAIASGQHDIVAVLGVEKVTDKLDEGLQAALALGLDGEHERAMGLTLTGAWALLMRRYMHEYGVTASAFAPFAVNAHANATTNPNAMYRFAINTSKFNAASMIAQPLNMLDCATLADGAAAMILVNQTIAAELNAKLEIVGSAASTSVVPLAQRNDLLWLDAVARSGDMALKQAAISHDQITRMELNDPHGIAAALTLEALGFAERGMATQAAADGMFTKSGTTPIANGGGFKARGDVGGASGIYQIVELAHELAAHGGIGLAQSLGGIGATAVTHIVKAER